LDKAVYRYPFEHYAWWTSKRAAAAIPDAATPLPFGALGENLTASGLLENDVWVGDCLTVGDVQLRVEAPTLFCVANSVVGCTAHAMAAARTRSIAATRAALRRWIVSELKADSARLVHHRMSFWPLAEGLGRKFDRRIGPRRDALDDLGERLLSSDAKGEVMKPDVRASGDTHRFVLVLHFPECQRDVAVGDENGRIRGSLAHLFPSKTANEEVAGTAQIANRQPNVVNALGRRRGGHGGAPEWLGNEAR
jgi:hypothetical protein